MPTTDQSTMPSSSLRRRWLLSAAVAATAVVAGALLAILLFGDGREAPEDVVAQHIEAWNARDLDAVEALSAPEIVATYDASAVGYSEFNTEFVGREAALEGIQEVWSVWDTMIISSEVLQVDGGTVTTIERIAFSNGDTAYTASTRCRTEVSDDGLIVRAERVVEGFE